MLRARGVLLAADIRSVACFQASLHQRAAIYRPARPKPGASLRRLSEPAVTIAARKTSFFPAKATACFVCCLKWSGCQQSPKVVRPLWPSQTGDVSSSRRLRRASCTTNGKLRPERSSRPASSTSDASRVSALCSVCTSSWLHLPWPVQNSRQRCSKQPSLR